MDAYRDQVARCPRCEEALEHQGSAAGCKGCGGVWLGEGRLDEMLRTMHHQPVAPAFSVRAGADPCACPTCGRPMVPVSLEGIDLDRCEPHGVWFDTEELERTLRAAAESEHAAPAPDDVPSVRIGLGHAILGAFGKLLSLIGHGVVGVAEAAVTPAGTRRPTLSGWRKQ